MKREMIIEVCTECKGVGMNLTTTKRCNDCYINEKCKNCNGKGKIKIIRNV